MIQNTVKKKSIGSFRSLDEGATQHLEISLTSQKKENKLEIAALK